MNNKLNQIENNVIRNAKYTVAFYFKSKTRMLGFTGNDFLFSYELIKDATGNNTLNFNNLNSFFSAGGSAKSNSTTNDFTTSRYAWAMLEPTVTLASNKGSAQISVYDRSKSVGWFAVTAVNVGGTKSKINLIKITEADGPSFEIQHHVFYALKMTSIHVSSEDNLDLFAMTTNNEVFHLNYNSGAIKTSILFTDPYGTVTDTICPLNSTEIVFYNPTNQRFDVYSTGGSLLRKYGSNIDSFKYLMKTEVGCQAYFAISTIPNFGIIYPNSHSSYTPNLFVSVENPFANSSLETVQHVHNGLSYIINLDGKMKLLPLLQQVTNFTGIFRNTSDMLVQKFTYNTDLNIMPSMTIKHTPLFITADSIDMFYVATVSSMASTPNKITPVFTQPLIITCKNPTFQGNEESREYYFKAGIVTNPDATREKNLLFIIRRRGLTRVFNGILTNPILWISVVFTLVALISAILIVVSASKQLKIVNSVAQEQGQKISYNKLPEQLRKEGKFGTLIQV